MRVAVPKETVAGEHRVALVPDAVARLIKAGAKLVEDVEDILDELREIAEQVRDKMRANPHTRDVNLDWNEMTKVVNLDIDYDKARALGLPVRRKWRPRLLGLRPMRQKSRVKYPARPRLSLILRTSPPPRKPAAGL